MHKLLSDIDEYDEEKDLAEFEERFIKHQKFIAETRNAAVDTKMKISRLQPQ